MVKKRISKKIEKLIEGYIARLISDEKLPVKRVILYGSRAKGIQKKDSDIDICVISPKFSDNFRAIEFLWKKRNDQETRRGLEPIGLSEKDFKEGSTLIEEIKKTGVEIKV